MATAKMVFGGGLNSSSGGELKLYLRCTGSTIIDTMPNNNRLNNGHGLKNVMYKEDLGRRKVYHRRSYIEGHRNCS